MVVTNHSRRPVGVVAGDAAHSAGAEMTEQQLTMMDFGGPMPAAIGRCADLYHDLRELRLAMEKEVEKVKARETEVQEHIINNLSKGEDTGAAGLRYRAQVVPKSKPIILTGDVNGWGLLCSWIRKNDRFDMLQKRLSDGAVMDWNEQEKRILPGTDIIDVKTLSVTKI